VSTSYPVYPNYGTDSPYRRAAQPFELAPAYVYLASDDSGYVTGVHSILTSPVCAPKDWLKNRVITMSTSIIMI
jgi:hypothetical protein